MLHIDLFSLRTGECLRIMKGVKAQVECLVVADDLLYAGYSNGAVGIWEASTGELTKSY